MTDEFEKKMPTKIKTAYIINNVCCLLLLIPAIFYVQEHMDTFIKLSVFFNVGIFIGILSSYIESRLDKYLKDPWREREWKKQLEELKKQSDERQKEYDQFYKDLTNAKS